MHAFSNDFSPTVKSPLFSLRHSLGIFADTFIYMQKAKAEQSRVHSLKMEWAQKVLKRLNVKLTVKGQISQDRSVLFLGSHLSYLDIPLLIGIIPRFSFVAKHEVSTYPIVGPAARLVETIFIKRENNDSRSAVRKSIHEALEKGYRMAIFPSGTTCLHEQAPWKKGSFEIAHEKNVLVQPFRLTYQPKRDVAYIDDDVLIFHLFRLLRIPSIEAVIEFHEPVRITNPIEDCQKWQKWAQEINPLV